MTADGAPAGALGSPCENLQLRTYVRDVPMLLNALLSPPPVVCSSLAKANAVASGTIRTKQLAFIWCSSCGPSLGTLQALLVVKPNKSQWPNYSRS